MESESSGTKALSNLENIDRWSSMAPEQIAALDPEGDFTKRHLLNPTVLAMLGDVSNCKVLDAGAGQGYFSRILARRGAKVTSLEPASALISHSVAHERREPLGVKCVQADLTEVMLQPEFDVVVCNMVLLSIGDWKRALLACVSAARPGGVIVISVDHPCFETAERVELGGNDPRLVIRDYLTERPLHRAVSTDFHRSLSTYLNEIFRLGLRLDAVAEPGLSESAAHEDGAPITAQILRRVPNFLVLRCTKPA